jgi:hypothetical protein
MEPDNDSLQGWGSGRPRDKRKAPVPTGKLRRCGLPQGAIRVVRACSQAILIPGLETPPLRRLQAGVWRNAGPVCRPEHSATDLTGAPYCARSSHEDDTVSDFRTVYRHA